MASDFGYNELSVKIGRQLYKLRTAKNVSVDYISKLLGITVKAYNLYERGARRPTDESLVKLSALYDVSLDYIIQPERYEHFAKAPLVLEDNAAPYPVSTSDVEIPAESTAPAPSNKPSLSPKRIFNTFCDTYHLDPADRVLLQEYLRLVASRNESQEES